MFETFENQHFTEHLKGYLKHMSGEYYPLGTKDFKNVVKNDIIPMLNNGTYMEQK